LFFVKCGIITLLERITPTPTSPEGRGEKRYEYAKDKK